MTTNFPGALDSYSTKVDFVDLIEAEDVNDLQDAVVAVETFLGTRGRAGLFEAYLTAPGGTTLSLDRLAGGRVSLWNGTNWITHNMSASVTLGVPGSLRTVYDVYLSSVAGVLTLSTEAWTQTAFSITAITNATPRVVTTNSSSSNIVNGAIVFLFNIGGATELNNTYWTIANVAGSPKSFELKGSVAGNAYTTGGNGWLNATSNTRGSQDGVIVDNSDPTLRYVGTFATAGAFATADSVTQRLIWNYYNRRLKSILVVDTTSHTYTTATTRRYRNTYTNNAEIVVGVVEEDILAALKAKLALLVGDGAVTVGLALNDTGDTTPDLQIDLGDVATLTQSDILAVTPQGGFNMLNLLQVGAATSPDFVAASAKGLVRC